MVYMLDMYEINTVTAQVQMLEKLNFKACKYNWFLILERFMFELWLNVLCLNWSCAVKNSTIFLFFFLAKEKRQFLWQ